MAEPVDLCVYIERVLPEGCLSEGLSIVYRLHNRLQSTSCSVLASFIHGFGCVLLVVVMGAYFLYIKQLLN